MVEYLKELMPVLRPWNTWNGFLYRCIYSFFAISVFDVAFAPLIHKIFHPDLNYRIILFIISYIVPFILYLVIFMINRSYKTKIVFSKKVNIVFAYNLQGNINQDKFNRKYEALIEQLTNEINISGLGNKIKIITCPPDVSFETHKAAEAKTMLGLKGSTLLIWGHIVKEKGKYKFKTQLSYEFGRPHNLKEEEAKNSVEHYIQTIIQKGLISSMKIEVDEFNDRILPLIIFILGFSTFTLGLFDKSEIFLKAFKDLYSKSSILRKKNLSVALNEVNNFLITIYFDKLNRFTYKLPKTLDETKPIVDEIVNIDNKNYGANIVLAYYFEEKGDRSNAMHFNEIASQNATKENYEHIFNQAYFALVSANYKLMIESYESVPDVFAVNVSPIISYLYRKYEKIRLPEYLFAEGYINYRWLSLKDGKSILRKFKKIVKDDPKYTVLIEKANELLNK